MSFKGLDNTEGGEKTLHCTMNTDLKGTQSDLVYWVIQIVAAYLSRQYGSIHFKCIPSLCH